MTQFNSIMAADFNPISGKPVLSSWFYGAQLLSSQLEAGSKSYRKQSNGAECQITQVA